MFAYYNRKVLEECLLVVLVHRKVHIQGLRSDLQKSIFLNHPNLGEQIKTKKLPTNYQQYKKVYKMQVLYC